MMGNVLSFQYDQAKNYAIQSIRYLKKDKDVIDVYEETDRDGIRIRASRRLNLLKMRVRRHVELAGIGWEDCGARSSTVFVIRGF